MKLRSTPLLAVPVLATLLLAGCFGGGPTPTTTTPGAEGGNGSTPSAEASEEPELVDGEPAPPGTRVGFDTYLTYTYLSIDKEDALLSAKLDSIEPATDAELAVLVENFGDQIDGYDIYMLRMTEKKVSGATVKYNDDSSYFDVVDENGERVQTINLIGWDGCDTQSFPEEYDTGGAEISQCYMGAVKSGTDAPAGMAYSGGYEDDNPYDYLDGKPLLFIP